MKTAFEARARKTRRAKGLSRPLQGLEVPRAFGWKSNGRNRANRIARPTFGAWLKKVFG